MSEKTTTDTGAHLRAIMEAIQPALPGCGIALVVFEPGKASTTANYIGNTSRADMLVALKELVARWEGRGHAPHPVRQ